MSNPYTSTGLSMSREALAEMVARNWWVIGLRGLLALLFGVCAFVFTGATILSLVLLFAVFALIDGGFAIAGAVRGAMHHQHWGYLALQGVVSIAAAIIAIGWPGATVLAFVLVLA